MKNASAHSNPGHCPTCGQPGKPVKPVTLESLLRPEARAQMPAGAEWHFCTNPECATVYFAGPDAPVFAKGDLTVRVGLKEREAPRPVCYCFNHTIEEIEEEVRRTGQTTVLDDIKTRMQEACWCETKSPLGSCCLSTVTRYVKAALEKQGKPALAVAEAKADCCAGHTRSETRATRLAVPHAGGSGALPAEAGTPNIAAQARPESSEKSWTQKAGKISMVGSVLAAVLASACCWLPLMLLAFGVSGVAVSATFQQYRPWFMVVTFALLGAAFYFAYCPLRRATTGVAAEGEVCCAPTGASGGDCCPPAGARRWTLRKFNRAMLWVVTAVALAFVFFPNYAGSLLGNEQNDGFGPGAQPVVVAVDGMDCPACAAGLEKQLKAVPGVAAVKVNYEKKEALIGFPQSASAPRDEILRVISKAGFTGKFAELETRIIPIAGMTCEACAANIQSELAKVPGVHSAKVSYPEKQAIVVAAPSVDAVALRKAVEAAGYQVTETTVTVKGK